ncbi:MAG: family 78 glycoside hydrolase catalytic domain [Armatimonadetes bacterium]|nr:family 78 glycoside hydrolase catalytic domain [Armatimonadota bacterium]
MAPSSNWLWTDAPLAPRNNYVRFRARLHYAGGPLTLHLTADTRYELRVNGRLLGQGPVRAWPNHWRYDSYDLAPHLCLGDNVLAVVVNHYGESTFQSIDGPAGMLAWCDPGVDLTWRASPDPARATSVPRISCQLGYEEQFDARCDEPWTTLGYDDSHWPLASAAPEADDFHRNLEPRGIPMLTDEPILPQRVISAEVVRSQPVRFTVNAKPYLFPEDNQANMLQAHGYLVTQIWSPESAEVRVHSVHKWPADYALGGAPLPGGRGTLHAGWNSLVVSLRRNYHVAEFAIEFEGLPAGTRFCAAGEAGGSPWAVCGPFALGEGDESAIYHNNDDSLTVAWPWHDGSTLEAGEQLWATGNVPAAVGQSWWQPVRPEDLPPVDVFATAYTDDVLGRLAVPTDGLLSAAEWVTIEPCTDGDVRVLLDYGREIVGHHEFEIDAPAGTIVDVHNFEFIQPDGRYNFAEGMNNSFRYVCRAGAQTYRTWLRRGFRYTYLILRDLTEPVKLRRVAAIFASYPQSRRGMFASSDAQLDRIWEVGAHTLRCCAEDTYTDCPTYEQTHWVGDARNEALVDWVVNGDPRLWFRCLEQTGQSLERSPITESEVPSGWRNLLPAWSFLWMRSCCEYARFTGDVAGTEQLLDYVNRNVDGIAQHTNADGLFEIRAWNMFDWAEMDTPSRGVVTHQNCMAAQALAECAELARDLGQLERSIRWDQLARIIAGAVNRHLWVEERSAYTDCLRVRESMDRVRGRQRELVPSPVFSQQTQTAAVMAGVAQGERAELCRGHLHHPPEGFVQAGSPFFEFFLLEAYQREGRDAEFIETIRRDWGFMVDMGATTFWEMWSGRDGRLTRSHCHGWSAAPTFFLSTWVLGVRPGGYGFAPCVIEPHPGDLRWCRGVVPTPLGDAEVQWENEPGQPFVLRVSAPEGLELDVRLPRDGTWSRR